MHIVCPHCTTSYAIKLASLGANGRTVRCSRCKQTWVAYAEDAIEEASVPAMAAASQADDQSDLAEQWNSYAKDDGATDTPVVDSPSIASDWPEEDAKETEDEWSAAARDAEDEVDGAQHQSWFRGLFSRRGARVRRQAPTAAPRKSHFGLPTACAAMGALVLALIVWRGDMVRLLPQTAAFYKMVGLDVNLRGLAFKDVKLSSETVDGKQVLVIEGVIVGEGKKPLDIPRLRFAVRDAQGAEIYAWNTVLEQTVLRPGERAFFRSRLASPPPEGRNIDVRFFQPARHCRRQRVIRLARSAREVGPKVGPMPKILIADDEDSMRQLVARAIAMDGHETVTAQDGAEALEILTREDGAFDLLLTDIQMPVMDGIALALSAARDFPDLTILLMTGFADQRERASNLNALVHDVVTKPFSVADIRTAVADALAAKKR
ncbi:putative Zn finger-like uncharacterized protein [Bradyrhizobium diazoefficiens]